ncbi:MAG: endolytic transglycosylase MltG [Flavobacteriales bacterium]
MKRWKLFLLLAAVVLVFGVLLGRWAWNGLVGPGTRFPEDSRLLYIGTGADLDVVVDSLLVIGAVRDEKRFRWLADRKNYPGRIKPGRYRIPKGMSMNELVNMLRAGEQEPVMVTLSNVSDLNELAERASTFLEPDTTAFLDAFLDDGSLRSLGLNDATIICLFIPDTYEFWWTTTPEQFMARMRREHDAFWKEERLAKADKRGMTPVEVATLASIVQAETIKMGDAPRIAGVYLNRLRIGMPLQADPTLKFALGLEGVNRILNVDKQVDSPYNTYRNTGLPPGPISMPEARFIDAVLDAEKHDYLYFCARADMSGYSEFSRSYDQHLVNARKYQKALDKRGIYR